MAAHTFSLRVSLLAPLLLACGGDPGAPGRINTDMAPPTPAAEAVAAPAGPVVGVVPGAEPVEQRFTVEVERPATLDVGAAGVATVTLTTHEPWHVNLDYPTSLELTSPQSLEVAQRVFEKHHARRLDDQGFEYEVAFTPTSAGEQRVKGRLAFAVCEEDACVAVKHDINFVVAVQ